MEPALESRARAADLESVLPRADPDRRTRILGILNLTPDSFHDGGVDSSADASFARARAMVDAGADALDLGAESSRPGAEPVPAADELARLLPVLERVVELGVPISVDTVKASVAREALAAGATIINDISALEHDPAMGDTCAEAGATVVLMHMRGSPRDMHERVDYVDVVTESLRHLEVRVEAAVSAGIPERRILVDPGIGFAKTADQSLAILRRLREYRALGRPIVLGTSRKSFLSRFSEGGTETRLEGTLATSVLGILGGADVLRVHDVPENVRVARVTEAVRWEEPC